METHEKQIKKLEISLQRQVEKTTDMFLDLLSEAGITHVNSFDGYIHVNTLKGEPYVKVNMNDAEEIKSFLKNNM